MNDTFSDSTWKVDLLYNMLRIRKVEEFIVELYPEKQIRCPVHLCIGQEAVAVGVSACLDRTDDVLSTHRSHGHFLAKGGDLRSMIAEIYGKTPGCSQGKGGSMHLIDQEAGFIGATPIVGSTIPIAVGVAFASQLKGESRVTAVFFGDGATEEGVFHESLNFAMLKKLPIIFVCENNQFSVYSPLTVRQPKQRQIYQLAQGHGMESYQSDGNDVLKVHSMAMHAVHKARQGDGPTFLEFKTYRWREHCGTNYDHQLGYRTESDVLEWQQRCPIENLKKKFIRDGILNSQNIKKMEKELEAEIEEAVVFAKQAPFPQEQALLENIYAP